MTSQAPGQLAGSPQRVLVVGATSAIAIATARRYAAQGCTLHLVARNRERLAMLADDLRVRGAHQVSTSLLDLNEFDRHGQVVDEAAESMSGIDIALICHGSLPDQQASEADFELARHEINTNGLSVIAMLTALANKLIEDGAGTIAVITSVAGDRGRQSNYVYGAVKSMVSTYLQGLRGRLLKHGIHVVDIRPGFVDSPMTAQFDKGPLWSSPDRIAGIIVKAIDRRRHTVYAPFYWRFIMWIVKMIPEALFKRVKL